MRKFFSFASVITAVAAAMLPSAAPAQAAESQCSAGQVCVWSAPGFGGQFKVVKPKLGSCFQPATTWPNGTSSRIGSIANKHGYYQIEAFDNDTCTGTPYAFVKPGVSSSIGPRLKSLRFAPVCDPGQVCFYENTDFSGRSWSRSQLVGTVCYSAQATGVGPAHAVYNMFGRGVTLYTTAGICLGPNYYVGNGNYDASQNGYYQVTTNGLQP
ncbi:peptidase inhibitor family I36 protein [Kitasatospora aureofaciens]|uniref:peptidase inhibitor family I36 protein n=1 Tax=Kitasatospora aureofaciens TaxID=1894 RepID=UPI0034090D48